MSLRHKRVQIDHADMVMKCLKDSFPGDTSRESGHSGEVGFFRHDLEGKINRQMIRRCITHVMQKDFPEYRRKRVAI